MLELLDELDDEFELPLLDELLLEFDEEFELEFDDELELLLLDEFDDELDDWLLDELLGAGAGAGGGGGAGGRVVGGDTTTVVAGVVVTEVSDDSDWMGTTGVGSGASRPSHAAAMAATTPRAPSPVTGNFQLRRLGAGTLPTLRSDDETEMSAW